MTLERLFCCRWARGQWPPKHWTAPTGCWTWLPMPEVFFINIRCCRHLFPLPKETFRCPHLKDKTVFLKAIKEYLGPEMSRYVPRFVQFIARHLGCAQSRRMCMQGNHFSLFTLVWFVTIGPVHNIVYFPVALGIVLSPCLEKDLFFWQRAVLALSASLKSRSRYPVRPHHSPGFENTCDLLCETS